MVQVTIHDTELAATAQQGADAFLQLIIDKTRDVIGGELNEVNMSQMSSDQITLIGYATLREELMDGGFIQLIHNGYGPFFFNNPFDLAVKRWGLINLCRLIRKVKKQYLRYKDNIEKEMTDEEFMAAYEQMPVFDDFDDDFISNEEEWSNEIAQYVDNHIDNFINIIK